MKSQRPLIILALALIAGAFTTSLSPAEDRLTDPLPKDRAGLDTYIREFIMKNPKLLRDALLNLEREEQSENTRKVLGGLKEDLYRAGSPEIGHPAGKVKIVEFFDYNCSYCRAAYTRLRAFLKTNPDTTLVLKDVASLGTDSEAVARIALAAKLQGQFEPLNDALMTLKGQATEARALQIAAKIGLDVAKLQKDAQSPGVNDLLARTRSLADRLSTSITPLFIIGQNSISGAPEDLDAQLAEYAAEIRKSGCEIC